MDKVRFGLWFGLLAAVWMSYSTWMAENQPPEPETAPAAEANEVPIGEVPAATTGNGEVPILEAADPTAAPPQSAAAAPERSVRVRTDVLDLLIDLDGGDVVRADVPRYPIHKDQPDVPMRLLDYAPENRWVFQTGFVSANGMPAPNHQQPFQAASDSYTLADGADSLEVRLTWQSPGGQSAEKVYTFRRGEYYFDLDLIARNGGNQPWPTSAYAQMTRVNNYTGRHYLDVDSYSFTGPVVYNGEESHKIKFEDLQQTPVNQSSTNGWIASIQHHFVAAAIPPAGETLAYSSRTQGMTYSLTALASSQTLAPGAEQSFPMTLFVGPKLQDQLDAAAPGRELKLTVDYGVLTVLSQPLFWILDLIHGFVRNWGFSIILTTILIKLAFYKLTATSGRSMAKMRKLAPRMKALQEKHKDDRQALSAAMMELYKKEKVNPAAGCLPILIQMPFFFAFYWVLVESVEMRQAPFVLWINDLSVRDPLFILPAIMMAAMWFQMRLNPSPPDPVQARVMQIMPFIFAGMFAFFPAGLVLYWVTNTLISIAQQWRINQLVARES